MSQSLQIGSFDQCPVNMKFVCAAWFILALSFYVGEAAADDDESVVMFIHEISHALQSQWEILEKIRYHTVVNKLWLKQLLAELNKIEGSSRVNRRNSLSGDDFLHNFREIVHELEGLQLMLNTTDGWNAIAFNNSNHTDALGSVLKNATLSFSNVETPNGTFSVENDESKEGSSAETTIPTPDIKSSTPTNGDAMTMSTATVPDMPAVIATLEKLNLLLINHIISINAATTTSSPSEDLSKALTSLNNMYREHFGQLSTPDILQTTTEHPTVLGRPGELTRIIESIRDLASYLKPRPSQSSVTREANATTGMYIFTISLSGDLLGFPFPLSPFSSKFSTCLPTSCLFIICLRLMLYRIKEIISDNAESSVV